MEILTLSTLADAMSNVLAMPPEEAEAQAEYVLDLFGDDPQITDNRLDAEGRHLLYQMEQGGLVTTRSETTTLLNGAEWRTHYWILKANRIVRATAAGASRARDAPSEDDEPGGVYAALPDACWSRR